MELYDFDDGFSTFVTIAVVMFAIFFSCVCCCMCFACYKKRQRQAIYSTPVVVTSQSYQGNGVQGPYPVSVQTGVPSVIHSSYQPQQQQPTQQIPMPPTSFTAPYPPVSGGTQFNQAPALYPPASSDMQNTSQTTPYPPVARDAPYPQTNSMPAPYPSNSFPAMPPTFNNPIVRNTEATSQVNPPTYYQAVGKEAYQKQPAYNPTYDT